MYFDHITQILLKWKIKLFFGKKRFENLKEKVIIKKRISNIFKKNIRPLAI